MMAGSCQADQMSIDFDGNVTPPIRHWQPLTYAHQSKMALPMLGYICPLLILITIVFNTLVVIVLFKKHMRTATNMLLTAMAISDMLTGVVNLPWWIYYYVFNNYHDPVSLAWCKTYYYVGEFLPIIFHTASIWLTMALAIQRYIFVCHPTYSKSWCSMERVKWNIFLIYVASTVYNVPRFFDTDYVMCETPWPLRANVTENSTNIVNHCFKDFKPWVWRIGLNVYFNIYYWFRVILVHVIPCTTLIVLNSLLLAAMRQAAERRKKLMQENRKSESKKLRESNCTTGMLIVVVSVFLVVEVPLAIVFILHICQNTFELQVVSIDVLNTVTLTTAFLIILSYPINFCIYCGMSKQFRNTFKHLFVKDNMVRSHSGNSTRYTCIANNETTVL
ncbi:PREDICTED: sex peptide receptor-like [Priapulus caudatus]|uniref:Sex peptide receptor-like n=1 Tax=Priapulus caudatus TaxID=37621 RepID=A0ABM1E3E7_PRICU|nr:PREDICTED: sex peptide receptor-like [Priapulus caudatus]